MQSQSCRERSSRCRSTKKARTTSISGRDIILILPQIFTIFADKRRSSAFESYFPKRLVNLESEGMFYSFQYPLFMLKAYTQNNAEELGFFTSYEEVPLHRRKKIPPSLFPKDDLEALGIQKCIRILPHDQDTGGFFIAVFQKAQEKVRFVIYISYHWIVKNKGGERGRMHNQE